jgi:hypothetical protein
LIPGGDKIESINPDVITRDEVNVIIYLKMKVHKFQVNNIQRKFFADDEYMTTIQINDTRFRMNKYMKVKTFKRLIIRSNDYDKQWPEFYNNDNGIYFEETRELKDVGISQC